QYAPDSELASPTGPSYRASPCSPRETSPARTLIHSPGMANSGERPSAELAAATCNRNSPSNSTFSHLLALWDASCIKSTNSLFSTATYVTHITNAQNEALGYQ